MPFKSLQKRAHALLDDLAEAATGAAIDLDDPKPPVTIAHFMRMQRLLHDFVAIAPTARFDRMRAMLDLVEYALVEANQAVPSCEPSDTDEQRATWLDVHQHIAAARRRVKAAAYASHELGLGCATCRFPNGAGHAMGCEHDPLRVRPRKTT